MPASPRHFCQAYTPGAFSIATSEGSGVWVLLMATLLRAFALVQPCLQIEKLRPREGKRPVSCRTANGEQSQNRDPTSRLGAQTPCREHSSKSLGASPLITVSCPH